MTNSLLLQMSDLSIESSLFEDTSELVSVSSFINFYQYSSKDLSLVLPVPVEELNGLQP